MPGHSHAHGKSYPYPSGIGFGGSKGTERTRSTSNSSRNQADVPSPSDAALQTRLLSDSHGSLPSEDGNTKRPTMDTRHKPEEVLLHTRQAPKPGFVSFSDCCHTQLAPRNVSAAPPLTAGVTQVIRAFSSAVSPRSVSVPAQVPLVLSGARIGSQSPRGPGSIEASVSIGGYGPQLSVIPGPARMTSSATGFRIPSRSPH